MRRSRTATHAVVGVALAVLVAVGVLAFRGPPPTAVVTSVDPAAFVLPALAGEGRVALADLRGTPLVVNFFASWCGACDAELPGYAAVSQQLRGQVTFVGVNSLETGDPLLMPRRHGIGWWPLARDVGGRSGSGLHDALGPGVGLPITAFYRADGARDGVVLGVVTEDVLCTELATRFGVRVG